MGHSTEGQPLEIFTLEMDFVNRLADSESLSAANCAVVIYDKTGTVVTATYAVGDPSVSTTKLQQKVKWATTSVGDKFKVSFRGKVGAGATDHLYEDDVEVEIID